MPVDPTKPSPSYYEIQIAGRLSQEQADWFGLALSVKAAEEVSSVTTLSGPVPDQAALFGVLNRIRDLGLKLISVNQTDPGKTLTGTSKNQAGRIWKRSNRAKDKKRHENEKDKPEKRGSI